jgi:hypothetical protein
VFFLPVPVVISSELVFDSGEYLLLGVPSEATDLRQLDQLHLEAGQAHLNRSGQPRCQGSENHGAKSQDCEPTSKNILPSKRSDYAQREEDESSERQ